MVSKNRAWTIDRTEVEVGYAPVQLQADQHCLTCGEPASTLELVDGQCFSPCRYGAYLRGGKRWAVARA